MKKTLSVIIVLTLSLSAFSQSNVYLKINHMLGTSPFAFNSSTTNNIGDNFNVNRLEYYISSISITHDGGTVTNVPSTWILANASTEVYELLGNYTITSIEQVTFSIGVETPTNHSDPSLMAVSHPLSPKSPSMHWGWSAGYRFIAMEGLSGTATPDQTYQLHALGDVNYFSQTIPTAGTTDANGLVIELNADYEAALKNINTASGVISHGEVNEAKMTAENFRDHVFTSLEGNSPVSIEKVEATAPLSIYPNPAANGSPVTFKVDQDLTNASLQITDLTGRIVSTALIPRSNELVITGLQQGIYMVTLKLASGEVIKTEKLFITK
jgi:hypothetical protein